MVITFVVDMIGAKNNGTTVTAMRTAKTLKELGHEVRFICIVKGKNDELTKQYKIYNALKVNFFIFNSLVDSNGMYIGKLEKKDYPMIRNFIKGSDVVHLLMPFKLERQVRPIAKAMNIPVTCAMHVQPENVSYNLGMGKIGFINSWIYRMFYNWMYKYVEYVHTPSMMMKDQMIKHHYKNKIYAISNGVSSFFKPMEVKKPDELTDKFVILMIGRLSSEKRQDLIIKAVSNSKYEKNMQIILCGNGPMKKKYQKLAKDLTNPIRFEFCNQEDLRNIINYSDLYIHASDAESEAISCIEAFSCGKVPIISDSKVSATNHFALDKKCLFKKGNYKSLQERIEYFYENRYELNRLAPLYIEYGKTFSLESCVKQLEGMFIDAINTHKEDVKNDVSFYYSKGERNRLFLASKEAHIESPLIIKNKKKP